MTTTGERPPSGTDGTRRIVGPYSASASGPSTTALTDARTAVAAAPTGVGRGAA
ncbi:hypothetical protein [Halosimplex pelagicum]|uniref:Uncharacterized protein n=1 Tax=Halosimplex pelagicum TaxID=869886 RepID=A0A7D5P9G7_9EURY|nr:hypothetical protein [Halosimplex pelagicum]QLH80458.1 hypothetical protein HZS54_01900 [Halosimplex pelagicum]